MTIQRLVIPLLLTLMLGLVPTAAPGAIVNTLRGFADGETGWSGTLSGSYGASGGNTAETSLSAAARLQWSSAAERLRLLGSARRTSQAGRETARAVMGHLRHNHRLGRRWSTLSFLQVQENPFQKLKSRTLAGLGFRCDLVERTGWNLAAGLSHMWEREQLEGGGDSTSARRLSLFVSAERQLRPGLLVDGLFFYQPRTGDFQDWRFFGSLQLNVALGASLTLFTGLETAHDSRPAALVRETDWETSTGFKAGF